jgi:hypothetical protein
MPEKITDKKVPQFKRGSTSISTRNLNQLVDAVNRPITGVNTPRQFPSKGKAGAVAVVAFTLVSHELDYLVCTDVNGNTVNVAKPYELRSTPFDGNTINGVTYTYASSSEREATDGTDTETQFITPNYVVGADIYASKIRSGTGVSTGGGDPILYIETDQGRAWAYDEPVPTPQIGVMVSLRI